jgi:hypothetical protein
MGNLPEQVSEAGDRVPSSGPVKPLASEASLLSPRLFFFTGA